MAARRKFSAKAVTGGGKMGLLPVDIKKYTCRFSRRSGVYTKCICIGLHKPVKYLGNSC